MRRRDPGRGWALRPLVAVTVLALLGAGPSKKKRADAPPPKVEETVGNLAYVVSSGEIKLEGVGLVVGLENTGSDPPQSSYRQKLLEEMRKAGVENANRVIADKSTAMVIVRLRVPVGVTPRDRLDVEIELPPASGTTSLAGGFLLDTRLREVMIAGGGPKDGQELAMAHGSVMIGSEAKPDDPKVGRVLGGGRCKKELPYNLVIKENRKSFRTAKMLEDAVNGRFYHVEGVDQKGAATAKTDQFLVLKIPRVYHFNQPRYFQVVKLVPMVDTPELRALRMEKWGKDLLEPKGAGVAALRLEALGPGAVEPLKAGLASPNEQVRFFAAEALAYLGDSSGMDVLADIVIRRPDFRAYALAAMSASEANAAHLKLRKLMDEADIEVRYGAFDALRKLDDRDPFLGQVRVLEEPPHDDEDDADAMALAIAGAPRRGPSRREEPFSLYIVDCEGPPLVHVARTRRCEIVIFGRDQKLLPPIVLGHGSILLNASEADDSVQISKIVPIRLGDSDSKVQSSLELGAVIRQTANLGASYPEIVTILQDASRQKNLAGPLVVDAVPPSSPLYNEAQILGRDTTAKKDDELRQTKLTSPKRPGFFGLFRRRVDR